MIRTAEGIFRVYGREEKGVKWQLRLMARRATLRMQTNHMKVLLDSRQRESYPLYRGFSKILIPHKCMKKIGMF